MPALLLCLIFRQIFIYRGFDFFFGSSGQWLAWTSSSNFSLRWILSPAFNLKVSKPSFAAEKPTVALKSRLGSHLAYRKPAIFIWKLLSYIRHSAFASAAGINTGPGDGFHQWRWQGIPANNFKWDFLKFCRWYGYFKKFHVIYVSCRKSLRTRSFAVHKKREECIERKANCWLLFRFWRVESYCLNVFNRCFKAELYKLKCDCTPDKLLKTKWSSTALLKCDWFVGRIFTAF